MLLRRELFALGAGRAFLGFRALALGLEIAHVRELTLLPGFGAAQIELGFPTASHGHRGDHDDDNGNYGDDDDQCGTHAGEAARSAPDRNVAASAGDCGVVVAARPAQRLCDAHRAWWYLLDAGPTARRRKRAPVAVNRPAR